MVTPLTTDPKAIAADIAREFREDSKRWTKGYWARDAEGVRVNLNSPLAVCWCLRGAIDKRVPQDVSAVPVYEAFDAALGPVGGVPEGDLAFVRWNDASKRTIQEVIDLCEKVAND